MASQKHGPFVRISPNHISVAHKDAITVIYGQGAGAFDKSPYYHAFVSDDKPSIFSTVDRQDHARKRRIVSQAFSYRALQSVTPFIHSNVEKFMERIDGMCNNDKFVDALQWLNFVAFDILSDLAFGAPIGMVANVGLSFFLLYVLSIIEISFRDLMSSLFNERMEPLRRKAPLDW